MCTCLKTNALRGLGNDTFITTWWQIAVFHLCVILWILSRNKRHFIQLENRNWACFINLQQNRDNTKCVKFLDVNVQDNLQDKKNIKTYLKRQNKTTLNEKRGSNGRSLITHYIE